ncbi:MAG: glycosyltransferase [Bacteroidia bacterium]|nr:glycosyltransferase [Bacteroidia bacterium]
MVCAHDEEHNLRELVPMLLAQDHVEFEIIIVEDRCNDATHDYMLAATKLDNRLKMVRVIHKPEHISGKKFALTLGIKAAKYDWLLLTDADCRPISNHWITSMSAQMGENQIVLGFSPYLKSEGLLNAFIRFESFLSGIQYMGLAILGWPYMGVGRNLAYRKSLFLENKGFNSHLGIIGGDDDLFINQHAARSFTRVCLGKESLMISLPKTTWKEYYVQKLRHLSVGKYYKFSDKLILGIFTLTSIFTWLIALPYSFFSPFMEWILLALILRWGLLVFLFHQTSKRLGEPFEAWKAPFLDFIYAFYYLVTGPMALVSKKVRWKS